MRLVDVLLRQGHLSEGALTRAVLDGNRPAHIDRCDPDLEGFSLGDLSRGYETLRQRWHDLKSQLLEAASRRILPVQHLNSGLEGLRSYLKMAEQMTKVAERLIALSDLHPAFTEDSPTPA